jgi:hypothetical protein
MTNVRLVASLFTLLVASPAMADDDTEIPPPPPGTIVVVTPSPVVVSGASQQAPGVVAPPVVAPTTAPQNESWGNVSHINGQVVKVGERGDYLYKWKKTNIASNPLGWMFGFYGISVSQAVSDNVAIRGDANMFDFDHESGYEIGGSVPIYFKRVYQGPFLEPGIIVRQFGSKTACDFDCSNNDSLIGPEMLFGWHWTFDSGMNVAVALGAAKNLNKQMSSGSDDVAPAGYFRIGYAF